MARHVVCPNCAAVNRLAIGRVVAAAKCGTCRQALFNGHPANADAETLRRQISRSDIPALIDVWAPWCDPCRMMAPAYEEAARVLEPEIRLVKLNSEANQEIASTLGIGGIPTLILMSEAGSLPGRQEQ